jgi:hypothetical protein
MPTPIEEAIAEVTERRDNARAKGKQAEARGSGLVVSYHEGREDAFDYALLVLRSLRRQDAGR